MNKNYSFEFNLSQSAHLDDDAFDELADAVHEAGCDDAMLSSQGNALTLSFDRESTSFYAAVVSAIHDLRRAQIGVRSIGPGDVVSAIEISKRCDVSREAVRQWTKQDIGFPPPNGRAGKSDLWSWSEISPWLMDRGQLKAEDVESAHEIAAFNLALSAIGNPKYKSIEKTIRAIKAA